MSVIFASPLSRISLAFPSETSSFLPTQILNTFRLAVLVGASYYAGTRIGFAWTLSGQPNSTFLPPNAILLACFLLAPTRRWWTFIVAVFPAHMLAQHQAGVPFRTTLPLSVGPAFRNCTSIRDAPLCFTALCRVSRANLEFARINCTETLFGFRISSIRSRASCTMQDSRLSGSSQPLEVSAETSASVTASRLISSTTLFPNPCPLRPRSAFFESYST